MIAFPPEPKRVSLPVLPESLDGLLDERTQQVIEEVLTTNYSDESKWCPHLRVEGDYWTYCALDHKELLGSQSQITEQHLQYGSRVDHAEIGMWCACGRQKKCIFYNGTDPSKAKQFVQLTVGHK